MDNKPLTAIVLGKCGTGKSKLCCSILGDEDYFLYAPRGSNVTRTCLSKTEQRFGVSISVVDTPGISRLSENEWLHAKTIDYGLQELPSGASAIILCIRMGQLEDELDVFKFLERNIGHSLTDYAVVVFTHLDQWQESMRENMEVKNPEKEFILSVPEYMKTFLHNIRNRYITFNGRLDGEEMDVQIIKLIAKIKQVHDHNLGKSYNLQQFRATQQPIWLKNNLIIGAKVVGICSIGVISTILAMRYGKQNNVNDRKMLTSKIELLLRK